MTVRLEIDGAERVFAPEALVVIGYAGRDRAAVEHHIDELAGLGVPRPASIPLFMVFPPWLITQEPSITVAGSQTSGEAEIVMVVDGDEAFVTVGSDHTDRVLEAVDIVASKGVCGKPVSTSGWPAAAVGDRWGDLRLRSHIDGGAAYQDGSAGINLPPLELVASIPWSGPRPPLLRGLHRHGARDRRHPPQRQLSRRAGRPGFGPDQAELPGGDRASARWLRRRAPERGSTPIV